MDHRLLLRRRMHNVRLTGAPFRDPVEVVRWLGAVQSQDYGPAKWSLGARLRSSSDAELDEAYNRGAILRTHVLRPTWHFVLPEDIRWLLELTAPRVRRFISYYDRRLGIDAALTKKGNAWIAKTIEREGHQTRQELRAALVAGGVDDPQGQTLNHIVMNAELSGVVCSGAMRGSKHTYASLDERAPAARPFDRDEAIAELTRRYFTSHGPATAKDFHWWCSLTLSDIKRGLEMVGSALGREEVEGRTYWFASGGRLPPDRSPVAHLLQGYDEYIVGYTESKFLLDVDGRVPKQSGAVVYNGVLLIDSQVVGHWKRTLSATTVAIDVVTYQELGSRERKALDMEAGALGRFLGLEPAVTLGRVGNSGRR